MFMEEEAEEREGGRGGEKSIHTTVMILRNHRRLLL